MFSAYEFINTRIYKLLKAGEYLSAAQFKLIADYQSIHDRLDNYLLSKGIIDEDLQAVIRARLIDQSVYNIDLISHDPQIISLVSEDFIHTHHFVPLHKTDVGYIIACGDPLDDEAVKIAKIMFGYNCEIYFTSMSKIISVYRLVHSQHRLIEAVEDYNDEKKEKETSALVIEGVDVSTAPAVKLCESILREAIANRASDIHIEPYEKIVRVRIRIDGVLYERITFDPKMYPSVVTRFKIISGANITERRIPQDGRFNLKIADSTYDFRFSTLPTVNGEKSVIRILDNSAFNLSLRKIGFSDEGMKLISPLLRRPHGIILLTGPTGCGKTTTLYSFIREVNTSKVNIVSVEDPVEYSIAGINQVQVNNKANLTFANALRSILRQDPNIIMIGEIRDEETAQIAIRAAITGHLVFSTLHTNDAPGAIPRLTDMGVESYLLSSALQAVIAQRLIRRLCPECKKKVKATEKEANALGVKAQTIIYEAVGCRACNGTGFDGRFGIHEILVIDDNLRNLITERTNIENIYNYLDTTNFIDLRQACINAILRGDTSFSELHTITIEE